MELLALIVEEIAILAAERRREEPTIIIRPPGWEKATARQARGTAPQQSRTTQPPAPQPEPRMTGHRQMLMAAMQRGMIRRG